MSKRERAAAISASGAARPNGEGEPTFFMRTILARLARATASSTRATSLIAALALSGAAPALAADPVAPPADDDLSPAAATAPTPPIPQLPAAGAADDDAAEEQTLNPFERIRDSEIRLEQTRALTLGEKPRVTISGYIDGGFFVPQGNGSGIVRDHRGTSSSPSTRASTAGCSWATSCRPRSTRAARSPTSATRPVRRRASTAFTRAARPASSSTRST